MYNALTTCFQLPLYLGSHPQWKHGTINVVQLDPKSQKVLNSELNLSAKNRHSVNEYLYPGPKGGVTG